MFDEARTGLQLPFNLGECLTHWHPMADLIADDLDEWWQEDPWLTTSLGGVDIIAMVLGDHVAP